MNAEKRTQIFFHLKQAIPNPRSELVYHSPFELLIAVILSAQATDKSVNIATAKLFKIANTPEKIFSLGEEGLISYIKTIGLYRAKAKHIIATCQQLVEHHQGKVPATREELEKLPGVGRKTANVMLNTAFGQATIAVDTHIFRVANRTKLAPGKTVREVEDKLMKLTPEPYRMDAHHLLILHGRYVCKARRPECERCVIFKWCEYPHKQQISNARSVSQTQNRNLKFNVNV